MKKPLLYLLILVVAVLGSSCSQSSEGTFEVGKNTFLLNGKPFVVKAAEIHYPRIPKEYWEHRIKMCKALGMNTICLYVFWNFHEPEEGRYNFEWLDRAVSLAEKYGLKVIMCTPTSTPPVWLSKKHPDILIRRDNGVQIQHGRRQHASWSSDCYRRYVENIVSRLAKHYGNNPTVIGWQIDNEPGHYGVVDYSENAQAKFRIWLQKKYGIIDKLNDTWGTSFWSETYQNFEQVCLPNQQEVPEKPNPHAMLDMNRWRALLICRQAYSGGISAETNGSLPT